MKPAWVLLFSASAFAQTTAGTDQTGSVTGTVTDAITHMPVKKTMVSAMPMGNIGVRNQGAASAVTDASGAFTISSLAVGKYRLMFQQQSYPQARFGGVSKTADVKPGEAASVAVELIPGASVSGHIVDEDGDPVMNCNVQVHPANHPDQGVPISGSSMSTDEGEYRAYGIAPGKYLLSAQCRQQLFHARPFSAGPDPAPSKAYPRQYYPLTSELKSAQVVELAAGSEKSGIDFQMMPTAVTQVRGAFLPGGADWRGGNNMILQLVPLDQSGMNMGAPLNQDKGTFEFRQVFPGSYMLIAFSNGADSARVGALQKFEVTNRPVDLALELRHAMDLSGKVEVENTANSQNKVTPGQIQVMLQPQIQVGVPNSQTQVNDDGSFTLKGVMPAPWRLQANGPGVFLKSAWLGSVDVTNSPIDLSAGASGTLRIVVSTNTSTIRGSAPAGQTIFAQRIDDNLMFRQNRGALVDQTGQYKLDSLSPGKYRLVLMEVGGGPLPDEGGQEVSVHEGETVTADLKAP